MRVRSSICRAALFVAIAAVGPVVLAQTPPAVAVGQSVEVREGDTWSTAKVVAKEGRRLQIQYDDGTQEWVTTDRIRAPGTPGTPAPAPKSADAPKAGEAPAADDAKPAAKKPKRFAIGASVEVKDVFGWEAGTIKNTRGDWYLVLYPGTFPKMEWVEPWRVRTPGDSYEVEARANRQFRPERMEQPPRDKPGPAPVAGGQDGGEASGLPLTQYNFRGVKELALGVAPWKYATPAETLAPGRITERSIPLAGGATNDVHERTHVLDVNGTTALLVYGNVFDPKNPVAEVIHLGTGDPIARAQFSPDTAPLAASPDGKRIFGHGGDRKSEGRVDVWDIGSAAEPKHVVSFTAYTASGDFFKDVERVLAIDATHLITLNNFNGRATAWEVGPGSVKPVWTVELPSAGDLSLSPDRKSFAISGDRRIVVGDALTGQIRGSIETSANALSSLSWRADGRRLCGLAGPTLFEFDLEGGKQLASLGLPAPLQTSEITHLAGDTVAVRTSGGDVVLLDVAKRAIVGSYKLENAQRVASVADKLVATTKNDKRRVLCAWTLPAKGTTPTATPLATVPAEKGTKVALDLQLDADEATRKMVTDRLTQQIADRGWVIGEPAAFRIVGRTTTGRSEQREYGSGPSFGPFAGPRETVTVTERITRLSVDVDGKSAWATQSSSMAGHVLSRKEGQSMQAAADEQGKANAGFLGSVTLPETIFAPIEALPAGVKSYTLANGGVRPN